MILPEVDERLRSEGISLFPLEQMHRTVESLFVRESNMGSTLIPLYGGKGAVIVSVRGSYGKDVEARVKEIGFLRAREARCFYDISHIVHQVEDYLQSGRDIRFRFMDNPENLSNEEYIRDIVVRIGGALSEPMLRNFQDKYGIVLVPEVEPLLRDPYPHPVHLAYKITYHLSSQAH